MNNKTNDTKLVPLNQAQIEAQLTQLNKNNHCEWQHGDGCIYTQYICDNFTTAVGVMIQIAFLAEQHNHHPDILLHDYRKVVITVRTHKVNGLTKKDFALATEIAALPTL